MFVGDGARGFQFHDETVFNDQVGEVFAQNGSVLVINGQWVLMLHFETLLLEAMKQRLLINLLQMPGP